MVGKGREVGTKKGMKKGSGGKRLVGMTKGVRMGSGGEENRSENEKGSEDGKWWGGKINGNKKRE